MAHTVCPKCLHSYIEHEFCPRCGPIANLPLLQVDWHPRSPRALPHEHQDVIAGSVVPAFEGGAPFVPPLAWVKVTLVGLLLFAAATIGAWWLVLR